MRKENERRDKERENMKGRKNDCGRVGKEGSY